MNLRVFSLAYPVSSLGPGRRVVLWVAGCSRNCPGCISPEMQPEDAGHDLDVERLAHHIGQLAGPFDGMTISGGEAFDQAEGLTALINILRKSHPAWTFMAYTGYYLKDLSSIESRALLDSLDIVIDGPYECKVPPRHALAGSGNQQVHVLSDKGSQMLPELEKPWDGALNFGLGSDSFSMLIGVASGQEREAALKTLNGKDGQDLEKSEGADCCKRGL